MADDTDQHRDKRPRLNNGQGADRIEGEAFPNATNHDRQDSMDVDVDEDKGAQVVKPAGGSAADEITLEQIQEDMGEPFLLCRSSKTLLPPIIRRSSL